MNDSQVISKVSKNLSLRLSPERKYAPKKNLCPTCCCYPCCCCTICNCLPCKCCHYCHCCPCTCFLHSPQRIRDCSPEGNSSSILESLKQKYSSPNRNYGASSFMGSTNQGTYNSPTRFRNQNNINTKNNYNPNEYEQKQFNDFLRKLMSVESEIEKIKINLSLNPDFNCEDVFRIFELEGRGFLDQEDIKYGLNLLDIYPTDQELKLFMKRFDLQNQGGINYADFFDIIVPFEKENRTKVEERLPNSCCPCRCLDALSDNTINTLKNLFNLILDKENEINNMRISLGTLKMKLREIFELLDYLKCGYFTNNDLMMYLQKEGLLENYKDADLLFIRLDKNRNGKIEYKEVEDEIQGL